MTYLFESESRPGNYYQTLVYADGTMSCNCKGWTRQVARDGSRTCRHCREILAGVADQTCSKKVVLQSVTVSVTENIKVPQGAERAFDFRS